MTKSDKSFCFRGKFGVRHARIGSLASSSFSLIHNPNGNREHAFQHSLSDGLEKDLSAEGQSSLCSDKASRFCQTDGLQLWFIQLNITGQSCSNRRDL
jgi:hypothetical protein